MLKIALRCFMIAAAIVSAVSEGRSQASPPKFEAVTELVVGDVSSADDPFTGWAGVRVRLGPGWKIYWKAPGDTGLPPDFNWSASSNLAGADMQWPVPHRTSILGIESVGYTGEVLFPVKLHLDDPDLPAKAELNLVLYACSTICVREERVLNADLSHPSSPDAQSLIDQWRGKVPEERSASLAITSIELIRSTPPRIRVETTSTLPFMHPDLFVAGAAGTFAGRPDIEMSGERAILTAPLQLDPADPAALSNLKVTLADDRRAVEAAVPPGVAAAADARGMTDTTAAAAGPVSWWAIIATALLGGLILNLMPCVFPVLSLKLLSFVHHDAARRQTLRAGLLASAAGIVVSFMALATALIGLKAAGATIGWGIQFQQPVFLAAMAAVTVLFAANLLGFFEVSLPSRLMNAMARSGVSSSIPSHFASGFAATLLATPCSAPFVGTAVSFALSRGGTEIYAVFAALGIGMAAPNLLIACVPNLAARLPRPGPWMLWLKRALAIPLLATAAWLVTLVGSTAGLATGALTAVALVTGLVVLWWRATDPSPNATIAVSSVLFLLTAGALFALVQLNRVTPAEARLIQWRPFNELDDLVRSGQTVFLDVTADWCVTCKVNKALVVNNRTIAHRLASDVVPVRGDWTRPDPRIALYLKAHGRYGLPFNAVFGPGAPDGIILPELLTTNAVLAAFTKSADKSSNHANPPIKSK